MSNVWFGSDFHFGHKNIQKFRTFVEDEEDNRRRIIEDCQKLIRKIDTLYVLGDAVFTTDTLNDLAQIPGEKYLIRGNHDKLDTTSYLKHFKQVYGILNYKEFWLSHAPVHPQELRGKVNLHGHVHYESVRDDKERLDKRYMNCCVENLLGVTGNCIISLDEIRTMLKE